MNEPNQTKTPRTDAHQSAMNEHGFTLTAGDVNEAYDFARTLELELNDLRAKAQAVVDRWESPRWKEAGPTAAVMNELRNELTKGDK